MTEFTRVWSQERAALERRLLGERIQERDGTFWYQPQLGMRDRYPQRRSTAVSTGFWRPVDFLHALNPEQVERRPLGVGYQAVVSAEANTLWPISVIPDLASYSISRIPQSRRANVRKALARHECAILDDPDRLLAEGFGVLESAAARTGQIRDADAKAFRARISRRWELGRSIEVTGETDGRLSGYLLANVVGTRAYLEEVCIADWGRKPQCGTALYGHAIATAQALGATEMFVGLWIPELQSLASFKRSLGARIELRPARFAMLGPLRAYLARKRPLTLARLGGGQAPKGYDLSDDCVVSGLQP